MSNIDPTIPTYAQATTQSVQFIADIQRQCQMHEMRQRAGQTPPRLAPGDYGPIAGSNGQAPAEGAAPA